MLPNSIIPDPTTTSVNITRCDWWTLMGYCKSSSGNTSSVLDKDLYSNPIVNFSPKWLISFNLKA